MNFARCKSSRGYQYFTNVARLQSFIEKYYAIEIFNVKFYELRAMQNFMKLARLSLFNKMLRGYKVLLKSPCRLLDRFFLFLGNWGEIKFS
jgi:hypothetical protein